MRRPLVTQSGAASFRGKGVFACNIMVGNDNAPVIRAHSSKGLANMPDISMRLGKDMLVLSGKLDAVFARQGIDVDADREFLNLVEPDSVKDAFRLESVAGAQCLCSNTEGVTKARLAHVRMEERSAELAQAAVNLVCECKPQHVIYEVGPCGLPVDPSNSASLKQNRDQYAQAVRDLGECQVDAVLLSGFASAVDAQCAIMGVRMVSDVPTFVTLRTKSDGVLERRNERAAEVCAMLAEYGADVVGVETFAGAEDACEIVREIRSSCDLPVIVQLDVARRDSRQFEATPENPYYCPDVMVEAAVKLRAAGVQFLRAGGQNSPAYTGALVAASAGFDVVG